MLHIDGHDNLFRDAADFLEGLPDPLCKPFSLLNQQSSASRFVNLFGLKYGVKTYRRAFINRALQRYKNNYARVMAVTGHFKAQTFEAFYARHCHQA